MSASCRTYFVCPAPPCPNGKLHLGHIGGVYLLADIFVRFQRMAGRTAYLVTGTDEHGSYTLVKACKLGRPVEEVATMHTEEILNCLNVMGIEVDAFVRTSSKEHHLVSRGIFDELSATGHVKVDDGSQLYCEACGAFAADSLAAGRCPDCGTPCDSNLCEDCGLAVQHASLRDPVHTPCGGPLALREIRQAYLDLAEVEPALLNAVVTSAWATGVKQRAVEWLQTRIRPLPMSRYFPYGVAIEKPAEIAGQTLLTWFEGLWCFETGIRSMCEKASKPYAETMRSEHTSLLFFMGQDNRFYYTVAVTASLIARGLPAPSHHVIQDFISLEGEKFSTSRDHALWADEAVDLSNQSVLRYYLSTIAKPFGTGNKDFTLTGLATSMESLRRYEAALRLIADGSVLLIPDALSSAQVKTVSAYSAAIDDVTFWDALDAIDNFFDAMSLSRATHTSSATDAEVSVLLSLLHPFVPELSARYGACLFDDWRPSLDGNRLRTRHPPTAPDFPWFSSPTDPAFLSAYNARVRRVAA